MHGTNGLKSCSPVSIYCTGPGVGLKWPVTAGFQIWM